MAELAARAERQRVHVLGAHRVRLAALDERRALRLGLHRRLDDRHAHGPEENLDVVVVLPRHLGEHARVLLDRGVVARGRRLLELLLGLGALLRAVRERAVLRLGRLAVEDVDGLDARLQQPDGPVEHALDVRRLLAVRVGEDRRRAALAAVASNRDEKLVEAHRRVDRDDAARVPLGARVLLDRARRLLVDDLHETLDAHD
mmetsp:Transcript_7442/g.22883  ORF Transcript_7442/g.22883 Transcript_7442/m.22883 type:complete len:202 (-) Transcript_7442:141-746(-)